MVINHWNLKRKVTIYELLKRKINIVHLTERLLQQYATATGHTIPSGCYDLLDLLKQYPVKNAAQFEEILVTLNAMSRVCTPLPPRLQPRRRSAYCGGERPF